MEEFNSEVFGKLCLQMLEQSQIPGNMLDLAVKFKKVAEGLACGESSIVNVKEPEQ